MKITILTQWYPPEPASLMHDLACDLQAFGHSVQVITGFPNYPSGALAKGYRLRPWMRDQIEGIDILRTFLYPNHNRSRWRRAANYLSFALSTMFLAPFLAQRPDVLFVYHPPLTVGLPAWVLSRIWRIPFVYQIQDMWPETLEATGMLTNERLLAWVDMFARWVYRHADSVCVISPGFKSNLINKGVRRDKIHVISNWVDSKIYYPASPDARVAEQLGLEGHFNIMFAGNIGAAQALERVLDAACLLNDLHDVQFVLVGEGVALPALKREAAERGLKNVRFLGRYPASAMASLYAFADVLFVHLKDDPLFRITVPHKLFAYMASGKPILAGVAGDAAELLTATGAGIAVRPEDVEALAAAVRHLYHLPAEERGVMAKRGLRSAQQEYSRKVLVRKLEQVMESAVARKKQVFA